MKKSRAVIVLILAVLAICGMGYLAWFGVGDGKTGSARNIKQGLDLAGGVSITYQVVGDEEPSAEDMADTIYKLQRRVEGYSTEAQVYKEGSDRINIEIPGVSDANQILTDLGRPGSLYFIEATGSDGQPNYSLGVTEDGNIDYILNHTIEEIMGDGGIVLDGTHVASAQATSTQSQSGTKDQQYVVSLAFDNEGTKAFAEATTKAYQNGETIGIYYDGAFVSVPTVNEPITGGNAQISGMADFEEADRLASTIRIGGLKLELEELRSNVVGAQLGSDAIRTSLQAGAIGFAIVCVIMIVVYLLPGFLSAVALVIYVLLTLLTINALNITLTLPGIAGVILAIGMAVDANVIIYARIREELATGKTLQSSIKIGFDKALSAILDGNITTLIAAAVLGLRGSGSVKGFATTLAMGIVLSMFTALVISRLLINACYAIGFKNEKLYGKAKQIKPIGFLAKKPIFFTISIVMILLGFVFMGVNKNQTGNILNYSLEFMGGTSTTVDFGKDMTIEQIESDVVPVVEEITKDSNVQTQKVNDTTQVIIKTRTLTVNEREQFVTEMNEHFGVDEASITAETISATVSNEMRRDAVLAVIIATLCMLIYIWFRFTDIRFAASAVLALVHDVLVVLTFYAVSKTSVGNTFIACMLTIVGYSINSTIVIFDRIRENLRVRKGEELDELVNSSITSTLTRSIYSNLTTFVMVLVLYILGVSSIRDFAAPLMVGIGAGAYSSVCVTGALWYVLRTKIAPKKEVGVTTTSSQSRKPAKKEAAKKENAAASNAASGAAEEVKAHGEKAKKDTSNYQSTPRKKKKKK
ncbi:MAG: protein translocase subunit SecD [Lachnospiraceae bacterium]|nr:protein translocase subunit SecD [Lachnospiraceae bacterium]